LKQTIAYPFEQMRRLARGHILHVVGTFDLYDSPTYTDVPIVDATATYDKEHGTAAIFVANRSVDEFSLLDVDLRDLPVTGVSAASTLHAGPDRAGRPPTASCWSWSSRVASRITCSTTATFKPGSRPWLGRVRAPRPRTGRLTDATRRRGHRFRTIVVQSKSRRRLPKALS
jgi:hypothetical protein